MTRPYHILTLQITLERHEPEATYALLVFSFSGQSWVKVSPVPLKKTNLLIFKECVLSLQLKERDHICIQLYTITNGGLNERCCQRLAGALTLRTSSTGRAFSSSFPLTVTDYFKCKRLPRKVSCFIACESASFVDTWNVMHTYNVQRPESIMKKYRPISAFVKTLYMPYYFDVNTQSRLPGSSYFLFPPFEQRTSENEWILHFQKLLLRFEVEGLSELHEHTIDEVAHSIGNGVRPLHILADALTDTVTCYAYRPDSLESFDDVFFNQSGDCEDFAKGILRAWYELERSLVDSSSVFLNSVKEIIKRYQAWAVLSSVLKRSFNENDTVRNESGHMFVILLPRVLSSLYSGGRSREASISTDEPILLEGTAKVSYLEYLLHERLTSVTKSIPKGVYLLQAIDTNVDVLARFYHDVSYVFSSDRALFNKYRNTSFLVVNCAKASYGVPVRDLLLRNKDIRFVPGPPYETGLRSYIENTYLPAQQHFMAGIPKLPILPPCKDQFYLLPNRRKKARKIFFLDVDKSSSLARFKRSHNVIIIREDKRTYRIEYYES